MPEDNIFASRFSRRNGERIIDVEASLQGAASSALDRQGDAPYMPIAPLPDAPATDQPSPAPGDYLPPAMISLAEGARIDRIAGRPIHEIVGIQPNGNGQVDLAAIHSSVPTIGLDGAFQRAVHQVEEGLLVLSSTSHVGLIPGYPDKYRIYFPPGLIEALKKALQRKDAPDKWEAPKEKQPTTTSDWNDKATWPRNESCDEWKKYYHLLFWVPLVRQEIGTVSQVVAGPGGAKMNKSDAEAAAKKDAASQVQETDDGKKKVKEVRDLDRDVQDAIKVGKVKGEIVPGKGDTDQDLRNRILWALRARVITEDLKRATDPPCSDDNCKDAKKPLCATVMELLKYEVIGLSWSFEHVVEELWEDASDLWHYKIKVYVQWWAQVDVIFSLSCICADIIGTEVQNPGEVPPEPEPGTPGPKPGEWKPKKDWKPTKKLPPGGIG
jgi:hypothetical protein